MRILAVIFWILAVICSGVGSRDTCVSKNNCCKDLSYAGMGVRRNSGVRETITPPTILVVGKPLARVIAI